MRRVLSCLALAAAFATATPAAARSEPHEHPNLIFRLRFEPEMNTGFLYRVFLADPDHPETMLIERSNDRYARVDQVDVTPDTCPAAAALVMRLASLRLPAAALEDARPYDWRAPRAASYYFSGSVRFPNGGEGEVTFYAYDQPGQRADPLLEWARGLVRAVDACRPRG